MNDMFSKLIDAGFDVTNSYKIFNTGYIKGDKLVYTENDLCSLEYNVFGVYSTNKHPERKTCEVVNYLASRVREKFGTVFGSVNIYGGGLNYYRKQAVKDFFVNRTTTKDYIQIKDGYSLTVTNPIRFVKDLNEFIEEEIVNFNLLRYSYDELERISKLLKPSVRQESLEGFNEWNWGCSLVKGGLY